MSLLVVWVVLFGFVTHLSQTEAIKASPHTFVVTQDEEDIILKIKGDEDDHWITNQQGSFDTRQPYLLLVDDTFKC